MKIYLNNSPKLMVLSQQTPMQSGLSDHNLLIDDGILIYNMMMQCCWNACKKRFNNGFGIIESDNDYQTRIKLTVKVLAEATAINPQIYVIALTEAPIKTEDISSFIEEASIYPSLERFVESFQAKAFTSMGVATFFDTRRYQAKTIEIEDKMMPRSLLHRIQLYLLKSKDNGNESIFSNMHLPFDVAKSNDNNELIESINRLIRFNKKIPITLAGDFNCHPEEIIKKLNNFSATMRKNNNFLLNTDKNANIVSVQFDTVDGILQTHRDEHSYNPAYVDIGNLSFFGTNPVKEFGFLKKIMTSTLGFFKRKDLNTRQTSRKKSVNTIDYNPLSIALKTT